MTNNPLEQNNLVEQEPEKYQELNKAFSDIKNYTNRLNKGPFKVKGEIVQCKVICICFNIPLHLGESLEKQYSKHAKELISLEINNQN
jgi:hypothetical protein